MSKNNNTSETVKGIISNLINEESVLTDKVSDNENYNKFSLFYIHRLGIIELLVTRDLNDDGFRKFEIKREGKTIKDIYKLFFNKSDGEQEQDDFINHLKNLIKMCIDPYGNNVPSLEEETDRISEELIISLYNLTWEDESDKEEILEMRKTIIEEAFNIGLKEHLIKIDARIKALNEEFERTNKRLALVQLKEDLGIIEIRVDEETGKPIYIRLKGAELWIAIARYLVEFEGIILQKRHKYLTN